MKASTFKTVKFNGKHHNLEELSVKIGKKPHYLRSVYTSSKAKWEYLETLADTPDVAFLNYEDTTSKVLTDIYRLKFEFNRHPLTTLHDFSLFLYHKDVYKHYKTFSVTFSTLRLNPIHSMKLSKLKTHIATLDLVNEYIRIKNEEFNNL